MISGSRLAPAALRITTAYSSGIHRTVTIGGRWQRVSAGRSLIQPIDQVVRSANGQPPVSGHRPAADQPLLYPLRRSLRQRSISNILHNAWQSERAGGKIGAGRALGSIGAVRHRLDAEPRDMYCSADTRWTRCQYTLIMYTDAVQHTTASPAELGPALALLEVTTTVLQRSIDAEGRPTRRREATPATIGRSWTDDHRDTMDEVTCAERRQNHLRCERMSTASDMTGYGVTLSIEGGLRRSSHGAAGALWTAPSARTSAPHRRGTLDAGTNAAAMQMARPRVLMSATAPAPALWRATSRKGFAGTCTRTARTQCYRQRSPRSNGFAKRQASEPNRTEAGLYALAKATV